MWWYHLRLVSSCYWSLSGVCFVPYTLQHLHGLDFGKDDREIKFDHLGLSRSLTFADDAVILAKTQAVLVGALKALNEES